MSARFRRLSAPGAAALSIWALEAEEAELRDLLGRSRLPDADHPTLAALRESDGSLVDEGVFLLRRGGSPARAEWHLHGGFGVAAALRARLSALGWNEDAPDARVSDGLRRLLEARAPLNARVAGEAHEGGFEAAVAALPPAGDPGREEALAELARWGEWGALLERPPRIVLAGPPNAGKSTLFNAWLRQERVTVSPHPGTTRDSVTAGVLLGEGDAAFEATLTDTAGLWGAARGLDREAVERALAAVREAWRVIWVFDAVTPPEDSAARALEEARPGDLRVLNRCDLGEAWSPEERCGDDWLRGSAAEEGAGLGRRLEAALLAPLGEPPPPGAPVPLTAAQRRMLAGADFPRADGIPRPE